MAYIKKDKSKKPDVRNGRVVFYLTQDDHHALTEMATKLGLTRSSLTTSIIERLLIGGFSPIVGAKLCYQVQNLYEARGHSSKALYFGIRPLPPLAEEEITKRQSKSLLDQIKQELKPC
jgi:hypothetical protein